jgi:phenylacetate-coenzyme A ligase PaaK-like adenylate-forming protein
MVNFKKTLANMRTVWWLLHITPDEIGAHQRKQLDELLRFVRANSPFYQQLYSHLPETVEDLTQLSPVTKPQLMANFDGWVTNRAVTRAGVESFLADKSLVGTSYLGRYLVCTSSGTTGQPGIFVQEPRVESVYRMVNMLQGGTASWKLLRRRMRWVTLCATGDHFGSYSAFAWLKRSRARSPLLKALFSDQIALSVTRPLAELVDELNRYQPTVIAGYATMIAGLADEQLAGRLHIRPLLISLGGEGLSPRDQQLVVEAFQCVVHEGYASVESPSIAFSCAHGWLHVDSRRVLLEPVDEAYQPVAPGTHSHTVLLTNLLNHIQPIIRYDLGDSVLVRPDPCPCGNFFPAIRVEGRKNDRLRFPASDGELRFISPMVFIAVLETQPGLHRYQLIQTGPLTLQVRLDIELEADQQRVWQETFERLRAYFAAQDLHSVILEQSPEPPAADPRSGKFHHVRVLPTAVADLSPVPASEKQLVEDLHA